MPVDGQKKTVKKEMTLIEVTRAEDKLTDAIEMGVFDAKAGVIAAVLGTIFSGMLGGAISGALLGYTISESALDDMLTKQRNVYRNMKSTMIKKNYKKAIMQQTFEYKVAKLYGGERFYGWYPKGDPVLKGYKDSKGKFRRS